MAASEDEVPEWSLASDGIKLIINNNSSEAKKLFLQHPDSLVMFSGYSFAVFMDALMTFEEDKLNLAIATLKDVEARCVSIINSDNNWIKSLTSKVFGGAGAEPKPLRPLEDQLETQIILADSQVCIAILTFLQQELSGYFKGGWVLRKAWKIYQKVHKEILQLYREFVDPTEVGMVQDQGSSSSNGYLPSYLPHSRSSCLATASSSSSPTKVSRYSLMKKSVSFGEALAGKAGHLSLSFFHHSSNFSSSNISKESIIRLMGAVSFGYGLFQLGISLLPPSLMKLINLLGFAANRQNGIACLMFARQGVDMRAPLATLSLLWYHTIVRPFYAIDGSNVQAGVQAATRLLYESEKEFSESTMFLFFKGRVFRLKSDIPSALGAFEHAVQNSNHREMKILALHEAAWCHVIELNYSEAHQKLATLKSSSRWSRAFYSYMSAINLGCCPEEISCEAFNEMKTAILNKPKGSQLEDFLNKRVKLCPGEESSPLTLKTCYWQLLVFEMLYLWNALPSCSPQNLERILMACGEVTRSVDEPMVGLSNLIAGCCYGLRGQNLEAIQEFRKCLEKREGIGNGSEDNHVSAFCHFELAALLVQSPNSKEEGKTLLQGILNQFGRYDFDQRLNLRAHSLLKQL